MTHTPQGADRPPRDSAPPSYGVGWGGPPVPHPIPSTSAAAPKYGLGAEPGEHSTLHPGHAPPCGGGGGGRRGSVSSCLRVRPSSALRPMTPGTGPDRCHPAVPAGTTHRDSSFLRNAPSCLCSPVLPQARPLPPPPPGLAAPPLLTWKPRFLPGRGHLGFSLLPSRPPTAPTFLTGFCDWTGPPGQGHCPEVTYVHAPQCPSLPSIVPASPDDSGSPESTPTPTTATEPSQRAWPREWGPTGCRESWGGTC